MWEALISVANTHSCNYRKRARNWTCKQHYQAATSFCQHPEPDDGGMCTGGAHLAASSQPSSLSACKWHPCRLLWRQRLPCKEKWAKQEVSRMLLLTGKKKVKLMEIVFQNRRSLSRRRFVKISNRALNCWTRMSSGNVCKGLWCDT